MAESCTHYTVTTVDIFFPGDTVCCARCPLYEHNPNVRKNCRRTGEYINDDRGRGIFCPLMGVDPTTGEVIKYSFLNKEINTNEET